MVTMQPRRRTMRAQPWRSVEIQHGVKRPASRPRFPLRWVWEAEGADDTTEPAPPPRKAESPVAPLSPQPELTPTTVEAERVRQLQLVVGLILAVMLLGLVVVAFFVTAA